MKLEICCYSIQDAIIAMQSGADRIEFCAGRSDGGLTPSYGDLLQLSVLNLSIPIHPMVRPRGGDFCYNKFEIDTMLNDIQLIKQFNFPGIVLGCLLENGQIDLKNMEKLINAADNLSITFHRAFDCSSTPLLALKQINDLGIDRLLTSGQKATAEEGMQLIKQLNDSTQSTIIIPASGVTSKNIHHFIKMGLTEFHSSATRTISSPMQYQNPDVSMSHSQKNEFLRYCVDSDGVKKIKEQLINTVN